MDLEKKYGTKWVEMSFKEINKLKTTFLQLCSELQNLLDF